MVFALDAGKQYLYKRYMFAGVYIYMYINVLNKIGNKDIG